MRNKPARGLRDLTVAAAWALLCVLLSWQNVLPALDRQAQDALFQRTAAPSRHIQVIGIDEDTISALGSSFTTWSRRETAKLINVLNADPEKKPAVIGVDIMFFTEAGDPEADALLFEACRTGGNVVVATQASFSKRVVQDENGYRFDEFHVEDFLRPYDALCKVSTLAHVNTLLDDDGVVRSAIQEIRWQGGTSQSLARTVAAVYAEQNGFSIAEPPLDAYGCFPIRYTAKGGAYYGGNSFIKVLDGRIPAKRFAGQIVLIGAYAAGMMDAYATPIDPGVPMNGVEIHANIADALLSSRLFTPMAQWLQLLLTGLVVLAAVFLFLRLRPVKGAVVFAAVLGAAAAGYCFAAQNGLTLHLVYLPGGVTVGFAGSLVSGYLEEHKRRAAVTGMFKQYVAPSVVDSILKAGGADAVMLSSRRHIAVLFSDVRSFTSLSEKKQPEQIVEILNQYLSLITDVAFRNGGTIDKFIGDGCMILFNAPMDQADYEYMAVKTAYEIIEEAAPLVNKLRAVCGRDVMLGIGVHAGSAVVGNIGTAYRMDYTAIGDTVNTASRLEHMAEPGTVVISESLYQSLSGRIRAESIGYAALKGKAEKLHCFRVTGLAPAAPE